MKIRKISVVVSAYNEQAVLELFYKTIDPVLAGCECEYELIFVNDGSKDATAEILSMFADSSERVKVINFSRNYGHEAAMTAGIDHSTGDAVICMDADLQHPVELIPDIIEKLNEGYDIITMVRTMNKDAGAAKNASSSLFYKVLNMLSDDQFDENASDYFAISKAPADVLKKSYRENGRFLRAYIQTLGFRKTSIYYEAKDRAAGESKYNLKKLLKLSEQAITGFSNKPLKISFLCAICAGVLFLFFLIYFIAASVHARAVNGLFGILSLISFMFTVLFALIGIIGEYLGTVLTEIRHRPIYLIQSKRNFDEFDERDEK